MRVGASARSDLTELGGSVSEKVRLRIGLPWHSLNSSNYGLGALTECQLDIIQEAADSTSVDVDFEILFWPDLTEQYVRRPNLTFTPFSKEFLIAPRGGMFAYARRADLVADIAGGDSFTDQYGVKRFLFQALTKAIVILAGTPLVLSPQTLGPFERGWCRRLAAWIMRHARAVVARDAMSSDYIRKIGADRRLIEATDVAFRLRYKRAELPQTGKIRVGLNVSGLLFQGGYSRENYFGLTVDYPELIRTLLTRLTAREDCEVHLIGHVLVPLKYETIEDDHRVALALAKEFGVVAAPAFETPSEAKSYIAAMDFFSGSRMHACIAAFSSGVPVVPLAYSRKFAGLFGTLGYPVVADCRKDSLEEIVAKFEEGLEGRTELKALIETCNVEAGERLSRYSALVADCLREAAARKG